MHPGTNSFTRACALLAVLALGSAQTAPNGYLELFRTGCEALDRRDVAQARIAFERCAQLAPDNANCAFFLACCAAREERFDEALDSLERAIQLGYSDAVLIRGTWDLAALHHHARFDELMARLDAANSAQDASEPASKAPEMRWRYDMTRPELSSDGERLVAGFRWEGTLWDVATGELIAAFQPSRGRIASTRFSPDGRFVVATCDDGLGRVYDGRTGKFLRELAGSKAEVERLSFVQQGSDQLVCGVTRGGDAVVWNLDTGKRIHIAPGSGFGFAAYSPDARHAVLLGRNNTAALVDVAEGRELKRYWGLGGWNVEAGFSADGSLAFVFAGESGQVLVIDPNTRDELQTLSAEDGRLTSAVFLGPTTTLVTSDQKGRLTWWDARVGERTRTQEHASLAGCVYSSSNGQYLLVLASSNLTKSEVRAHMLDAVTGELLWQAPGDGFWFPGASFARGDEWVALSTDSEHVDVRESRSGKLLRTIGASSMDSCTPAISRDGQHYVVACSESSVRKVEIASGRSLGALASRGDAVESVEYDPSGTRLAGVSESGSLLLWDAAKDTLVSVCDAFEREGRWLGAAISFSPDGSRVLTWSYASRAALWSANDGSLLGYVGPESMRVAAAAWSHDGERIASADRKGTVHLWSGHTGEPMGIELPHPEEIGALDFDPTGPRLATGCYDGFARVWDLGQRTCLLELRHEAPLGPPMVCWTRYSPDGELLITGTNSAPLVFAWDPRSGEQRWKRDYGSGLETVIAPEFDPTGQKLFVHGMVPNATSVVDPSTGKTLIDLTELDTCWFTPTADERFGLASSHRGVHVLDGEDFHLLFTRTEFEDAGYLLHAPSGHVDGTSSALHGTRMIVEGESYPLDSFASVVFDPARVRAAAAGVPSRPVKLTRPPSVALGSGDARVMAVEGNEIELDVIGEGPGVHRFELERDGTISSIQTGIEMESPTLARLRLRVERTGGESEAALRIRSADRRGLLSRPLLLTVKFGS